MTLTPRVLAARIAPSTSGLGAWSAPMASTAIVTIMEGGLPQPLFLGHFDHFTSMILPAMGTDAVGKTIFVTGRTFGKRGPLQMIVGAALSPARGGVSSFRIRHSSIISFSIYKFFKGAPTVIRRLDVAIAGNFIAIGPANRTDSLATFAANPLHRQLQQDLLLDDVGKLETQSLIEPDFGFSLVDLNLVRFQFGWRTVKQIESLIQRVQGGGQATVAVCFKRPRKPALNSYLPAAIFQNTGRSFRMNTGNLT